MPAFPPEADLRTWRVEGRSLMVGPNDGTARTICDFRLPITWNMTPHAALILAAPGLLASCEEAFHELRIRCGCKPGDHAYDSLARALRLADAEDRTP
jgi:hypothetical protein